MSRHGSGIDVIVMGLGAVGSAAAWRLAAAGQRVLGFDRWSPPHVQGSTHGETRVTRETAWEGERYVPLVRRANVLWRELEREAGVAEGTFFLRNGGLFAAPPGALFIEGSRASADAHGVPYEVIDAAEMRARWPHFEPTDAMVGFVDPGAGILFPEPIVRAEHALARKHGADLRTDEAVETWATDGDGVRVTTARGAYRAGRLVICTGAWMPPVLAPLGIESSIERNTIHWFTLMRDAPPMDPSRAPVHLVYEEGGHATAIFPSMNGNIKLAAHGSDAYTTAATIDRMVSRRDRAPVTDVARRFIPRCAGEWRRGATCMYTITPTGHFLIDRHPEFAQVVLASACNGFGFKFSSVTGEIVAGLALSDEASAPAWASIAAATAPAGSRATLP